MRIRQTRGLSAAILLPLGLASNNWPVQGERNLSKSKSKCVRLSELREISVNFPGDVFVLAAWILANDMEWSARQRNTVRRTTLHGLVGKYAMLTGEDATKIRQCLISAGMPLDATLEPDEYQTPNQALHLAE